MKIELKHKTSDCWACAYQERINKACKDEDFGIEFYFDKPAGTIVPTVTYTIHKGRIRIPIRPPIEVNNYRRKDSINLIETLSDKGIIEMVRKAKQYAKKYE